MKEELNYVIIEYSDKDHNYLIYFIEEIERITEEIVNFFEIKNFDKKINIILNDNLELFRKKRTETGYYLEENGSVPLWCCGFSIDNRVETLCFDEYRKTKSHENDSLDDLLYLILHEFTHSCHRIKNKNSMNEIWFKEGLATTISHQFDKKEYIFDVTIEQLRNSPIDYRNYYTMFKYVLDTYGKEYILKLLSDEKLLISDTPRLFNETKEYHLLII